MKTLNQVLSVAISAALVVTSAPWQSYAVETAALPEFVKTFTPPTRLGYVVNQFEGKTKNPVILIQDLHANLGVQKKISGMLELFHKALAPNGQPIIIGREAEWKEVDLSYLMNKPAKVRKAASDVLLKNAYIAGTEYFALTNPTTPARIIGIDDESDYGLHDRLTRNSFMSRMNLAAKADELRKSVEQIRNQAPRDLKRVWSAEESYINGDMGIDELARRLHLPTLDYASTEQALLDRKLELAANTGEKADLMKNAVLADHYLGLLTRLFRQQMTMEEVQYTFRHSSEILGVVKTLLPDENMTDWAEILRSAVDYYAVALLRDKPLAENTIKLAESYPDQSIVSVTGGFHTDGIMQVLRARGISFVVIAPVVESHTLRDEMLYLARSMKMPMDVAQITADVNAEIKVFTKEQQVNDGEPLASGPAKDIIAQVEDPTKKKPVDLMQIADINAPLLESIPTTLHTDAGLLSILNEGLQSAKGLELVDDKFLANVKFVVADNRTDERTFENSDGNGYTVVVAAGLLRQIQQATGEQRANLMRRLVFGAINKARTNVDSQNSGEFDTTASAITNMLTRVPKEAAVTAFQDVNGAAPSPFSAGIKAISAVMEQAGVNNVQAQTKWLKKNQGFVLMVIAGMMKQMEDTYGVRYADSGQTVTRLTTIMKTYKNIAKQGADALAAANKQVEGVIANTSNFLRTSNPTEDQVKRLNADGSLFGTSA